MGEQETTTLVGGTGSHRRHPPATYISPQDKAALAEGKPTSWQGLSASFVTSSTSPPRRGLKKPENRALEARLLAELPPHYNPGNQ